MSNPTDRPGRARLLFSTFPALLVLLGVLAYGSGQMFHGRLLAVGEHYWPEYHALRVDPAKPECDPAQFVRLHWGAAATTATQGGGGGDLLDGVVDEGKAPAGDALAQPTGPAAGGGDLLDGVVDAPASAGDEARGSGADLLDEVVDAPRLAPAESGASPPAAAPDAAAPAVALPPDWRKSPTWKNGLNAAEANWTTQCLERHDLFEATLGRITDGVRVFRAVETGVAEFVAAFVGHLRHLLLFLVLVAAATATWTRTHISLRSPRRLLEHRVAEGAQLVASVLLAVSAYSLWRIDTTSGVHVENEGLHYLWMGAFTLNALTNAYHLARPPGDLQPGGSLGGALLCVPLYVTMALIAGTYFLVAEEHPAGLAIYLSQLPEHALLYINVGLYVWIGMLLKHTRLARLTFDLVRPWKLTPELLAALVVVAAALPTAYSGASGIFVIAVGGVIYEELRRAGARRQLALATTAVSGSLGVVLNPCLLVVIVASLNKQVTTDELYGWGRYVFMLTAVLFFAASLWLGRGQLTMAPPRTALPESLKRLRPLVPYTVLAVVVLLAYKVGLGHGVDEHTAPFILPMLLLALLVYDRRAAKREAAAMPADGAGIGFRAACRDATTETTGHIGALLMLMALSMAVGGVIDRGELMSHVPQDFGSPWATMGVLIAILVVIGMTMDPYGAVILVSATIATVAYRNGIHPAHFWMTVLVAFELGYLTPPVALNQLLTNQVVGDTPEDQAADRAALAGQPFWIRHERTVVPVAVMGIALLVVAFLPLFWLDKYIP